MKIIDLDILDNERHLFVTKKWIADSFGPVTTDKGVTVAPCEAIYFVTTKEAQPLELAASKGLTHDHISHDNYLKSETISDVLHYMIGVLNHERAGHGMVLMDKFDSAAPKRVYVLTNREMGNIQQMGAIPIPISILERAYGHV